MAAQRTYTQAIAECAHLSQEQPRTACLRTHGVVRHAAECGDDVRAQCLRVDGDDRRYFVCTASSTTDVCAPVGGPIQGRVSRLLPE